ncbi:MAG TPA: carboxypeptidase-like regulatory domain-containing protein [Draconibacterium sp.]|nr:carboxypeptidase-like regulatory domain-containing protein [Draconibacterium sp.]
MKKILLVTAMFLLAVTLHAKDNETKTKDSDANATIVLTGSIVDQKSGESLVGVEVKIEGTDMKTYTDFDGNFAFKNVKPGEYKLVTNYISYEQNAQDLTVNSNENNIKIKLQTSN